MEGCLWCHLGQSFLTELLQVNHTLKPSDIIVGNALTSVHGRVLTSYAPSMGEVRRETLQQFFHGLWFILRSPQELKLDCSHEIKRCLLLGRKALTNLDRILKSRDTTLPTKVHLVKAMVCPVVMYGCESWTIKKAERWRINAFELWCWRRLLRVPRIARRSNQSILKEINPEYWLEGLMWSLSSNTLTIWHEEPTHWKRPWCWERLRVGEGDNRGWDGWMASPTQWTWIWANLGASEGQRSLACCSPFGGKEVDIT